MSRSYKSNKQQNKEWGSKRIGNEHFSGIPGTYQKKCTARRERLAAKKELVDLTNE